tara:strand:- start:1227 stop:1415 length:189 start_codon:yes stop_codon:yes gene_type:complete
MLSGVVRTLDLPVTAEQIDRYLIGGELLQNVFSNLPKDQREFIKTGITQEEWDETFAEDQDE